tara:strand:- start:274 stop:711 length:438 start_codon:yes stop_codon:yes gene_type:complete
MIDIKVFNSFEKIAINDLSVEKLARKILSEKSLNDKAIISIIFCDNKTLNNFKIKYFDEDVFTDIVTFKIEDKPFLEAELYISTEMAIENAKEFKVSLDNEIIRLISHGILHLIGYDDRNNSSSKKMFSVQEEIVEKFEDSILDE